ncbi:hypothetical protein CcrSwift_gp122 [Caulobacter phage CcrSwift]|uniref:Uncharacterized protein n=1 Tax=Caulobacter phage CcrSwift TaxID=2927984 RepID=K4JVL8_9CAUD|nr:hypothetical protein CcrMagneto_gp123 [Caulobacter virus Magneto]YP_006989855.1 hypothetical protein D870_gp299 [Caulobacter phage CcrSwift]AFU87293.1 hypothetical protein CcrMagneto_gp123 [Caulobacter virus Magneto]AFU88440.1 hypothetical protein CcrSwift_gp122 [Caulobacter phage CcrSwift]
MTLLFSRRVAYPTRPSGGFLYALVTSETHSIQIGLGHESASGLNVSHVMTLNLKPGFAYEIADRIEREGFSFKAGRLAEHFGVDKTLEIEPGSFLVVGDSVSPKTITGMLADAIREAHDAVWGHPQDWEIENVPLGDGRCLWLAYDSEIDKIRLGIGYYDENNIAMLGDQSFAVGKRQAGDFAVDVWTRPGLMYFYALPPRWPEGLQRAIGHTDKQKLAKAFLKLADVIWRGEVKTTGRRPLSDEEIEAMHARLQRPAAPQE